MFGNIPSQIGELSQLTELSLANNLFEGQIPEEIGKLSKLELLLLNNNRLNGVISSSIKQLPLLGVIEYGNNPKEIETDAYPVSQTGIIPQ